MEPTLGGFIEFITNIMQPPSYFDPNTSVYVPWAFNYALNFVNSNLLCVPTPAPHSWSLGSIAVYNLAADTLVNWAQDQPGDPQYPNADSPLKYWAYVRKDWNVLAFIPGIVQTSSDESTSVGYMIPEGFSNYTLADLQLLKTPYGRQYLAIAQQWGTNWVLV